MYNPNEVTINSFCGRRDRHYRIRKTHDKLVIFAISRGVLCCTRVCYMVSHESHLLHHAKPCSSSNPMSLQLLTSSNDCLLCLISACACLNCCSVLDFYQAKGQITASRPSTYSGTHSEHCTLLCYHLCCTSNKLVLSLV